MICHIFLDRKCNILMRRLIFIKSIMNYQFMKLIFMTNFFSTKNYNYEKI